jgi:polyhydroxyalkanoate synthase
MARSLRHAREHHGATELDALGYCVGGTFLTVHLARHPSSARRLALLCAPIDFSKMGRMNIWADPASFPLDDLIDNLGNFPKELMGTSFQWLRPEGNISKWRALFDGAQKESFVELWSAMETWNSDAVDFYGEAYREYVRNCYFENRLINGGWTMAGRPVDGHTATMPALAISASKDHICPPAAAEGLLEAWGGPTKSVVIEGGHVGVCVGRELPKVLKAWSDEGHVAG